MSQQVIFEPFRIIIENVHINYDEIRYWGYDCEAFSNRNGELFISYNRNNTHTSTMSKSLYDEFDRTLKQKLKELIERNQYQCLEP